MITREQIKERLGGLDDKIQDGKLAEQVLDVYMLAIEEAGWDSIEDLDDMPFTLLTDTRGLKYFEHTVAVTKGAIGLAEAQTSTYSNPPYSIDMDLLIAGGLVHDVGKLVEFEKTADGWRKSLSGKHARHPIYGAILAAKAGMPEKIYNICGCHAKEGDGRPQLIETVLIHQSDFATFNPLVMMKADTLIL